MYFIIQRCLLTDSLNHNYANHSMKQINWALDKMCWCHHCLDTLYTILLIFRTVELLRLKEGFKKREGIFQGFWPIRIHIFKVLSNQSLEPVSYKQIWRSLYPWNSPFFTPCQPWVQLTNSWACPCRLRVGFFFL